MSSNDTTFVSKLTTITAAWLNDINNWIFRGKDPKYVTSTGSANAQVITLPATSLYSAYADGDTFTFKAGYTNTGTMTLQVIGASTLAAKAVKLEGFGGLGSGMIVAGGIYTVRYNGTAFDLQGITKVNVMSFGATGDGTTDDSTAISNAIASGREVYFPPGTYIVKNTIAKTSLSNFSIRGAGQGLTTIKAATGGTFSTNMIRLTSCDFFTISDMTLDGDTLSSFDLGAAYGVFQAMYCNDYTIKNIEVKNFGYIGIGGDGCKRFKISNNYVVRKDPSGSSDHSEAYCIIFSSANASYTTTSGVIDHNICKNATGVYFTGTNIIADGNDCSGSYFGCGVGGSNVGALATTQYGRYLIVNNRCYNGVGHDAYTAISGIEIIGAYSVVANNYCYGNGGDGITSFLYRGLITGNICWSNGTDNDAIGNPQSNGIRGAYSAYTQTRHYYTTVSNNRCFDSGGGTQKYGYYEQDDYVAGASNFQYNTYLSNDFTNNVTGDTAFAGRGTTGHTGNICAMDGLTYEQTYSVGTTGAITAGATYNYGAFTFMSGCSLGDYCVASLNESMAGCGVHSYVSATNEVTVFVVNHTGAPVTLGAAILRVKVFRTML